jgi:excisionase family DNA binding protein
MATAKRDLTNPPVQGPRPKTNEDVQVLIPIEAAEFLRVSLDQLYHLTSSKKVPFAKVGGALRFDRERLQEFVSNGGLQGAESSAPNGGARKAASRGSKGVNSASQSQDRSKFRFKTPARPTRAKK